MQLTQEEYYHLIALSEQLRSAEQQQAIDSYEQSLQPKVMVIDAPLQQHDVSVPTVDVGADPELKSLMDKKAALLDTLLPSSMAQDQRDFLSIVTLANCFAKFGRFKLSIELTDNTYKQQLARSLGLLSFNYIYSEHLMNRDIKSEQAIKPYAPICTAYDGTTSLVRRMATDTDKTGNQLVVWHSALKYEHNDDCIGNMVLELGEVGQQTDLKNLSEAIDFEIDDQRVEQKRWFIKNKDDINDLVTDLDLPCPSKMTEAVFQQYKLLLVLAAKVSPEVYQSVYQVMMQIKPAFNNLTDELKLLSGLSIVVPDYASRNPDEQNIATRTIYKLLQNLNKSAFSGLTKNQIAPLLNKLGIKTEMATECMGIDTTGTQISLIMEAVKTLDTADQDVTNFLTTLNKKQAEAA